jgi:hypothetical protein
MLAATPELFADTAKTVEIHDGWAIGALEGSRNMAPSGGGYLAFVVGYPTLAVPPLRRLHLSKFLSDLLNAKDPDRVVEFVRRNGIVDFSTIRDSATDEAPASVKAARDRITAAGMFSFAFPLEYIYAARHEARTLVDHAKAAAGVDMNALSARNKLRDRLNDMIEQSSLVVRSNDPDLALCIVADSLDAAVAMAILGETLNSRIRPCIKCGKYFGKVRKKQLFCSQHCKSTFHVYKQREKAKQRKLSVSGNRKRNPFTRSKSLKS